MLDLGSCFLLPSRSFLQAKAEYTAMVEKYGEKYEEIADIRLRAEPLAALVVGVWWRCGGGAHGQEGSRGLGVF